MKPILVDMLLVPALALFLAGCGSSNKVEDKTKDEKVFQVGSKERFLDYRAPAWSIETFIW